MTSRDFPPLKNDLILRVARGEKVERAPCWVMRQAGRYLPEFREVRKHHDFFQLCETPELSCKITLQPIDRYSGLLDASIIFSDILVIPKAMGMKLQMLEGKGPTFDEPLATPEDIKKLNTTVDVKKELGYVMDAISLTRQELNGRVPLFGFIGAPWTLLGYMIEGGGSKTFTKAKSWLFKYPQESKDLLQRITDIAIDFLAEQIIAGAQIVQVFDSWAGELSPTDFATFSLPYLLQIPVKLHQILQSRGYYPSNPSVPTVIFAKGAWYALEDLAQSDYNVISLDWTHDPAQARKRVGPKKVLQGNMDPNVLYGPRDNITKEVERIVHGFGGGKGGYIVNLGHGITPGVNPEDLKWFLEENHRVSSST